MVSCQVEMLQRPATQLDKGSAFRALHKGPRALVIANAWDAGSARILAGLGFSAIATSSWASAYVYGRRDHAITREQALAHARAIADATDLPVSADLESGFGAKPDDVAEPYRQAAAGGLVGATIEDASFEHTSNGPLLDIGEATERVTAAVESSVNLNFHSYCPRVPKASFTAMTISKMPSGACVPTRRRGPMYSWPPGCRTLSR